MSQKKRAYFIIPAPPSRNSDFYDENRITIQHFISMVLCSMQVVTVERDCDDNDNYVISGTARDIRRTLDAFKWEIQQQIELLFGPDDILLYNELSSKLDEMLSEELLSKTLVSGDEPSICQRFINIYRQLASMGYNTFPEKAEKLIKRLQDGDVGVYEQLEGVKNFLRTVRYDDIVHIVPSHYPYKRAERILCDIFKKCWMENKRDEEKK